MVEQSGAVSAGGLGVQGGDLWQVGGGDWNNVNRRMGRLALERPDEPRRVARIAKAQMLIDLPARGTSVKCRDKPACR